jgi:hypothetical protein
MAGESTNVALVVILLIAAMAVLAVIMFLNL